MLFVFLNFIPFDVVTMFETNGNGSATLAHIERGTCFVATIYVVFFRTVFHNRIGPNIETTPDVCSLRFAIVANLYTVSERITRL